MNNEKDATNSAATADEGTAAAPAKAVRSRRASAKVTSPAAAPAAQQPSAAAAAPAADADAVAGAVEAAPAKKAPVRRSRAKKAAQDAVPSLLDALADGTAEPDAAVPAATPEAAATAESAPADAAAAASAKAPAKRPARRRATAPVMAPASVQGELHLEAAQPEGAAVAAAEAPAKKAPARKAPARSRAAKKAETTAVQDDATVVAGTDETTATDPVSASTPAASTPAAGETAAAAPAKAVRSRRRTAVKKADDQGESNGAAGVGARTESPDAAQGPAEQAVAPAGEDVAGAPAEAPAAVDAATHTPANTEAADAAGEGPAQEAAATSLFLSPAAGISALFLAPDLSLAVPAPAASHEHDEESETGEGHDDSSAGRRGRNRHRRGGKPAGNAGDEAGTAAADAADEPGEDDSADGVTSRRRRRRRRGEADLELTGGTDEDPPNTVTRVRAPRTPAEPSSSASNRVTSLRGSTRLEAKKQRRRDSRDSGRRRTVITEAEFLARRESVDRVMVVRQNEDRIQIGVMEDGILAEHFVSKTQQDSLIGNVYLGKVQNVLPSMEAAFVDIGRGRNAVLYAGEVDWDAAKLNGQPRRIENALKSGDSVLVQVSKDPVGHKGARLTSQVSLPGRYLVYVPGGSMTGISRKLPDVERNRLKRVLKDHLPENAGVIVRTAAEGASEEELTNDINRLRAQWEGINNRATSHKTLAPEMLYAEPDLTIKVVRDVFNEDFSKLIVSGEEAWDTIEAYVTYVAPDLLDRLEKWTRPEDIFGVHRIDEQISKALERKVFLPSGGSLVIDRTEAMTVVDVNTGKFTGSGGNLEETVTKNNLEAAEEVVRQLRLRDIGGIIVIDFIDMVLESNRDLVLRRLVECLGRDRTKHQVAEVTSLGLVQMTRKRMGTGLLEVFGELCETCAGRGMVTHEIPVEHRRVHTVAVDTHHAHASRPEHRENERTANRSTRSERKRNRNNRPAHLDNEHADGTDAVELSHDPADGATEAQKVQKAHEARAALANIAAAAAAAHHGAGAGAGSGVGAGAGASSPAAEVEEVEVKALPASLGENAIVTLGGEAIELPRGHHNDTPHAGNAEQAQRLAGLAEALDQLAGSHAAAGEESGNGRPRRARRNRSARSAQGGADMSVETSEPAGAQAPATAGSGRAATADTPRAEAAKAQPAKKAPEPIIMLGVGVPASEL
ncbi:Rne/Rng family ribonuclease [Arthrobacter sp. A2-55]|uniref:Rne/Rng family ribonuclease n=1 Tax=Arthrobacter sp. A2-55 TaxID=2897337 RepID=UPI0021CDD201|nr:Rne/Rng family ribonuclease [Arthrobacter sp. A2-55]MCU6478863.1 Rne/Rng family ribonuclease [Arthrobacter sp. A2-55]